MTGQQKRQTAAALSCGDSSASVSSPTNITASGTVCGQVHILPIVESSSPVPGMAKWLYGRSTDAVKISTLATHHLQHDPRANPAERPIAMAPTYHRETNGKMVLDVVKWKRPAAEDAVMPSSISGQGGRVAAPGLGGGPAPPAAFMNRGHHQQQQQQPAMVGKSGGGGAAAATTASDAAAKKAKEDEEARLKAEREALRLNQRNDSGSSKPPVSIPSVFANDGRAGGAAPPQQQAQQSYQPQGQQHQQLQHQQMQQQPPRSAVASGVVSPPPSLPLAFLSGSGNVSQGDHSAPALLKEKHRTMDTKPSSMEEKRRDAKKATTVSTTKQTAQQKTQQAPGSSSAKQKQQQQQQQQSAPPPPAPVSIPASFSNPGSATTLSRNVSAVPPPPPPANFVTAPSGGVVAPAVPGAFLGGRTTSSQAVSTVPPPPPPQIGKNRPRSGPASGQGSPMSVVVGSGAFPRAPAPAPPQAFVSVGAKEQQSLPPSSMYQQQRSGGGGHASTSSSASPVPSATISRSGGGTSAAYHQVRDHGVHHSGRNSGGGSHPSYLERAQRAQDQRAWQSHPTAPPPSYAAASSSLGGAPGSSFGGAYGGGASKNVPRNEPAPQPQSSTGLSALGVQNHSRNKRARSKSVTPPPQPGDAQSGGVDADVGRRMFSDMPRGQVFVFDTCSMLNIDPRALKALAIDNTVVVPWVTVHELDNHNHNFEPNRNASGGGGDRSREDVARRRHLKNASREIRDVLSWGLELFRLQKRTEEGRGFDAANCKNNDDRILGCAVYFKDLDEMRSRNVLLVTDDGFLKIKARAEEVNAINVPELLAWPSRR